MGLSRIFGGSLAVVFACQPSAALAFFFFVPIPNLSKPPPLQKIIDALEKSEETKALAYVSEDRTFGSKYWVWGQFAGRATQEDADKAAMARCELSLQRAKAQEAGGKPLYDFGKKVCELHPFQNKTVLLPLPPPPVATPTTPPAASPAPSTANDLADAPSATKDLTPGSSPPAATASPVNRTGSGTPPAVQATPAPASSPPQESPTARKLRELNQLLKDGLITDAEYQEKRKAILTSM